MSAPELQDGQTYYRFTFVSGEYASRAQTRRAIMQELRRWACVERLNTSAKRSRIADLALADHEWLRRLSGQVITSVGRDVVDAVLRGRWEESTP